MLDVLQNGGWDVDVDSQRRGVLRSRMEATRRVATLSLESDE